MERPIRIALAGHPESLLHVIQGAQYCSQHAGTVVTKISEAVTFWEAEAEHQDYLQRYPDGYTCHFLRPGWKLTRIPRGAGI